MTTASITGPVYTATPRRPAVSHNDLTDRQVYTLVTVCAVVLIAAILALAVTGGPGLVAATTSVADLTAAAFGILV